MDMISQIATPKPRKENPGGESAKSAHKKKWAKAHNTSEEEKEMKKLESFLFVNLYSLVEFGTETAREPAHNAPLFFMDKSADSDMVVYEEDFHTGAVRELDVERKPVWVDDKEEVKEVDIFKVHRLRKLRTEAGEKVISGADYVARLRAQHAKLSRGTEWANIDRKSRHIVDLDEESDDVSGITVARGYEDEANDILRENEELVVRGSVKLLLGLLENSRLMDANAEEPSGGPINSVHFHRNGQLLLTVRLDRRLRFFQVDGKRNTKVESIFVEDCPIHKASFLPDGSQVILSGRRKFFYSFDIVKSVVDKI